MHIIEGQFSNGDKYAHNVYLCGYMRRFSVWYSANRQFQDAEAIDKKDRCYPVTKAQRARLCRLFHLTDHAQ